MLEIPRLFRESGVQDGELVFVVAEDATAEQIKALQVRLDEATNGRGAVAVAANMPITVHRTTAPEEGGLLLLSAPEADPDQIEALRDAVDFQWGEGGAGRGGFVLFTNFGLDLREYDRESLLALREQIDELLLGEADDG